MKKLYLREMIASSKFSERPLALDIGRDRSVTDKEQ
jgi:hypothetical protein